MDPTKKRKFDENGVLFANNGDFHNQLTLEDARKMIERFSPEQLVDILQNAIVRHPDVLSAVRSVADSDPTQRKLFIRGLVWETSTENLRNLFASYGELEEAVVVLDKVTGKSKGYGFVIFKHVDGAVLALKEPSKKIDGRVTVTQLAAAGNSGTANSNSAADASLRKIYVANVPYEMTSDRLLAHFAQYGEIEEGPLGFDKLTGKSRGFALFVYKKVEGAQAALVEPVKAIDGKQLNCQLAIDGKKGKPGAPSQVGPAGVQGQRRPDGMALGPHGPYAGPGGPGSYVAFPGGMQGPPPMGQHPMNMSVAGPGLASQAAGAFTGSGGYAGAGVGGPYVGPVSAGCGVVAAGGSGPVMGGNGAGGSAPGSGSSVSRPSPGSGAMPAGGYPESGHYSLSYSSSSFPIRHQGKSSAPKAPTGGTYPTMPSYY